MEFLSTLKIMYERVQIYRDSFYYKEPKYHRLNDQSLIKLVGNRCKRILDRRHQNKIDGAAN